MAIFHLNVKCISRSHGKSATAAAAYRSGTRIHDERTGELHDYTRKGGVADAQLVLPDGAPEWARDREQLWNRAELAERRRDSTVAREFEVALPHELSKTARHELALELARSIVERHGCAADVAIHEPDREGDLRNHHAHILCTTRRLTRDGLTAKTRELDERKTGEVVHWRERWATLTNEHLKRAGVEATVDHRSLADQGIERAPTRHFGPVVTERLRRGKDSYVADRIRQEQREDIDRRLASAAERGQLEREAIGLARAIVDTETTLKAALAQRSAGRSPGTEQAREPATPFSIDEQRRLARERWFEQRQAFRDQPMEYEPDRKLILDREM